MNDLQRHPTEVTDVQQTEDSSPAASSSPNDHTEDVEKINIYVIYAWKQIEIFIFPLEKISYLLQQACDQFHKKAENMSLIFDGKL